ncbi:hypothetical protein GEMRC1_001792 [Eukaryota sp. GEM-RC1]
MQPVVQDRAYKIVIIGDSEVGKSSLLRRFCDSEFDDRESVTIGIDFRAKTTKVDSRDCKLTIYDTAGQCKFRTLCASFYRQSDGILLVYDVTKRTSFSSLKGWLEEVERYLGDSCPHIMIVGNKIDRDSSREVDREMGMNFAREQGALFVEASARQGDHVEFAFHELVRKIIDSNMTDSSKYRPSMVLESSDSSNGCCT